MVIDILFFLFAGDRVWTRFEINPVEVAATGGWRKYFFLSYFEEEYVWFYRGFEMNMGREGEGDLRNEFQEVESSRGR